jgi:eukaryotic-like serine/threonine-protein kinase
LGQDVLESKQQQQSAMQVGNAKQALLRKPTKTTAVTPNKRQLSPKLQVTRKKQENTPRSNNHVIDAAKPWEYTYSIPKDSDELEQVIREENQ